MRASIARRRLLAGSILAVPPLLPSQSARAMAEADMLARLADLEGRSGGRLGVAVLDTATGRRIGRRVDERFPMCSTFKFLAAAFVLERVEEREESLDRRVTFTVGDLVPWSPVTKDHVGEDGMTVGELCEAAMMFSDNTAGNLLLASFGGPAGLTAFARSIGDDVTRLDRYETALNEARPGDLRDTTTPAAMRENLHRLILGNALARRSRRQLAAWLIANKVGDRRLRAGIPKDWRIGDRTGSGNNGVANDIGILWPPGHLPIIVSAYLAEAPGSDGERDAVLAEVGRIIATSI